MTTTVTEAETELDNSIRRGTPEGRFRRYCGRRSKAFAARLIVTILVYLGFVAIDQGMLGAALFALVVGLDAVEYVVLQQYLGTEGGSQSFGTWYSVTSLLGGMHGAAVAMTLMLIPIIGGPEALWLATTGFLSVFLDTSLYLRLHKGAAIARLIVFGLAILLLAEEMVSSGQLSRQGLTFLAIDLAILIFIIWSFVAHVQRAREHSDEKHQRSLKIAVDLAQSNMALRASREETQRLASAMERVSDSVVLSEADTTIIWVNEGFTRLTGYPPEEAVGQSLDILAGPGIDDETIARMIEARQQERGFRQEISLTHKNGQQIWVEIRSEPIFHSDGTLDCYVSVERDISRQKEHERAELRAVHADDAASRAKYGVMAALRRDISMPLDQLVSACDLLRNEMETVENRSLLEIVTETAVSLKRSIGDILEFSAIESEQVPLVIRQFDLSVVLESAVATARAASPGEAARIVTEFPDETLPVLMGDPERLTQVLVRLLENASQNTAEGEVALRLDLDRVEDGFALTLAVSEAGPGLAPEQLETLFEANLPMAEFGTETETGSEALSDATQDAGIDLGLPICYGLAQAMGGQLSVWSQPGCGSVFTLRLVLPGAVEELESGAETQDCVVATGADASESQVLAGRHILVADDNRTNLLLLDLFLAPYGVILTMATTGQEAVDQFRLERPDLILMDMRMPQLDGLQATRAIRDLEAIEGRGTVPILALISDSSAEDRTRCNEAGMNGTVAKPLRRAELVAQLATFFDAGDSAAQKGRAI